METSQILPETMTSKERLQEVCSLLARGFLRMRTPHVRGAEPCAFGPLNDLTCGGGQSVHRVEPQDQLVERNTR